MHDQRFTFLCTEEEKSQLRKLSNYHHRSQGDVVRMLLRQAISDLAKKSPAENKTTLIGATTRVANQQANRLPKEIHRDD
jgi:hypothetical protein